MNTLFVEQGKSGANMQGLDQAPAVLVADAVLKLHGLLEMLGEPPDEETQRLKQEAEVLIAHFYGEGEESAQALQSLLQKYGFDSIVEILPNEFHVRHLEDLRNMIARIKNII